MHTEGWRKLELHGTGVNDTFNLKRANETGGEFGGNPLQGKVFRPEPNLLSGSVLGGRQTMFICLQLRAGGCAE